MSMPIYTLTLLGKWNSSVAENYTFINVTGSLLQPGTSTTTTTLFSTPSTAMTTTSMRSVPLATTPFVPSDTPTTDQIASSSLKSPPPSTSRDVATSLSTSVEETFDVHDTSNVFDNAPSAAAAAATDKNLIVIVVAALAGLVVVGCARKFVNEFFFFSSFSSSIID